MDCNQLTNNSLLMLLLRNANGEVKYVNELELINIKWQTYWRSFANWNTFKTLSQILSEKYCLSLRPYKLESVRWHSNTIRSNNSHTMILITQHMFI